MSDIIFKTRNPLEAKQGTGVTLTKNGQTGNFKIDGSDTSTIQVSIGQADIFCPLLKKVTKMLEKKTTILVPT